jgi:hypothetical protein
VIIKRGFQVWTFAGKTGAILPAIRPLHAERAGDEVGQRLLSPR